MKQQSLLVMRHCLNMNEFPHLFLYCTKGQFNTHLYLLKQGFCCSTLLKDSYMFSYRVFHRAHNAIHILHQSYNSHRRELTKKKEFSFQSYTCSKPAKMMTTVLVKHSRQMVGVLHLMQAPASLQASA